MHVRVHRVSHRGVPDLMVVSRAWAAALLLAVACSCLALAGCTKGVQTANDVAIVCEVAPTPPREGDATITVTLTGADRRPVTGATVKVEGNMSHPGMRPVFADATEVGSGQYRAPFAFSMAGDWIISVNATLSDGRQLHKEVDVRGVASK